MHEALRDHRKAVVLGALVEMPKDFLAQVSHIGIGRQLALKPPGERGDTRADIADQFGVRIKHLLDMGGGVADMDHPGTAGRAAHQERRLLHRVVTDRDDQIGAVDRVMNVVAFRERGGAEIEVRPAGHRALAHLRVEEGNPGLAHEIGQRIDQAGPVAGGADHDQRTLCFQDHRNGPLQRRG